MKISDNLTWLWLLTFLRSHEKPTNMVIIKEIMPFEIQNPVENRKRSPKRTCIQKRFDETETDESSIDVWQIPLKRDFRDIQKSKYAMRQKVLGQWCGQELGGFNLVEQTIRKWN